MVLLDVDSALYFSASKRNIAPSFTLEIIVRIFNGKFHKSRVLTGMIVLGIGNPSTLLRRHVRGRKDPLCRVRQ